MRQLLPAGLCRLIRLIFTFGLMASPWRRMFYPWPDSDNVIQSFWCTDESQLLLWLNLYWIDINVHWFVTLIWLNSVITGKTENGCQCHSTPAIFAASLFTSQQIHIQIYSEKGNVEASIQLNLVFQKWKFRTLTQIFFISFLFNYFLLQWCKMILLPHVI